MPQAKLDLENLRFRELDEIETEMKSKAMNFMPETLNEEQRTVDFVMATDDPADLGWCYEILGMEKGEYRSKRLDAGIVPVMDWHPQKQKHIVPQSIDNQHGTVISYRTEGGKMIGTCLFAKDERSDRAFQKIKDGVLKTGSVGFLVYKYLDITPQDQAKKVYRAIDWEVFEFSLTSIPEDPGSQARSFENESKTKTKILTRDLGHTERNQVMPQEVIVEKPIKKEDVDLAVREAEEKAQTRILGIQGSVRSLGLEDSVASDLIARGLTLEAANTEVIKLAAAAREKGGTVNPLIGATVSETTTSEERVRAIETAIESRFDSSVKVEGLAREFAGLSLYEMQKESLRKNGMDVRFMDKEMIIRQAFQGTSDFPMAAGNVLNRQAGRGYNHVTKNFENIISQGNRNDFKEHANVSLSDAPELKKKNEHGDFETGFFKEGSEKFKIETFGRKLGLTRELFYNDDLDLFAKVAFQMGLAGGRKLHKLVFAILNANYKMSDGKNLFDATHKNLLAGTTADLEALAEKLLILLRAQTAPEGAEMGLEPGYLIVGSKLEVAAKKLITAVSASKSSDVNVFANTFQGVIVENSIPDKAVILSGRKEEVDLIQVDWLRGNRGVNVIQTQKGAKGIEYEVFMDVGVAPGGHRGFYKGLLT